MNEKKIEGAIKYLLNHSRGLADEKMASELTELIVKVSIPKMTEDDWRRVVNEKFYVRTSTGAMALLEDFDLSKSYWAFSVARAYPERVRIGYDIAIQNGKVPELVREKGLRQIHIKGHPHPECHTLIEAYFREDSNLVAQSRCYAGAIVNWDDVYEYVCL